MMKSKLLFISIFLLIFVLNGCNVIQGGETNIGNSVDQDSNNAGLLESVDQETYESPISMVTDSNSVVAIDREEMETLVYESVYLNSADEKDLIELCSHLATIHLDKPKYYQMVLKYFPILFSECKVEEIYNVTESSYDTFYAVYVSSLLEENLKDKFRTSYYEYKGKAEDVYLYSSHVYLYVIQLENLNEDDYQFLHDEAIDLYEQSIREDTDYNSWIDASTCVISILVKTENEKELELYLKEIKEYNAEHFS